jgi:hypothetical protein
MYIRTTVVKLLPADTGLSLTARILTSARAAVTTDTSAIEISNGEYSWTYTFTDNFVGYVDFYSNTNTVFQTSTAIFPPDANVISVNENSTAADNIQAIYDGVTGAPAKFTTLTTTGTTTLNALTVSNATSLNTLATSGTTTLNALTVSGATTLNGLANNTTTTLTGNVLVSGTTTINGLINNTTTTLTGNVLVSGTTTLSAVGTGAITANSLAITNNASVGGTTTLNGNVSLGGTLGITGLTTLNALTVTNATNLNTLATTGTTTLNALTVSNATSLNTLGVTGTTTFTDTVSIPKQLSIGGAGAAATGAFYVNNSNGPAMFLKGSTYDFELYNNTFKDNSGNYITVSGNWSTVTPDAAGTLAGLLGAKGGIPKLDSATGLIIEGFNNGSVTVGTTTDITNGVVLANSANHGGLASVITLQTPISATVPDTQKVDIHTIKTKAVSASDTVTFANGTVATSTNISDLSTHIDLNLDAKITSRATPLNVTDAVTAIETYGGAAPWTSGGGGGGDIISIDGSAPAAVSLRKALINSGTGNIYVNLVAGEVTAIQNGLATSTNITDAVTAVNSHTDTNLDTKVSTRATSTNVTDAVTAIETYGGVGPWKTATGFSTPTNVTDAVTAINSHTDTNLDAKVSTRAIPSDVTTAITNINAHTDINLDAKITSRATPSDVTTATGAVQTHGDTTWATATGFSTPTQVAAVTTNVNNHTDTNLDAKVSTRAVPSDITTAVTNINSHTDINLDEKVSTRLPTTTYVLPDNATITLINNKTTNLPAIPASQGDITSAVASINSHTDTNLDAKVSTRATPLDITTATGAVQTHGDSTWVTATGFSTPTQVAAVTTNVNNHTDTNLDAKISTRATPANVTTAITTINSHTDSAVTPLSTSTEVSSVTTDVNSHTDSVASSAVTDINAHTDSVSLDIVSNIVTYDIDSTGGEVVSLSKAIEVILAITGGKSTYNPVTMVWEVYGRDGITIVFQGKTHGQGNRSSSEIL